MKRVLSPSTLAAMLVLGLPGGAALGADDEDEMYKTKNCFACHRIDRNTLGPSFRSVAAKYAGEAGADDKLARKIREGGAGVWGSVPMPPQPQVTEAEALTLARWVLKQQ